MNGRGAAIAGLAFVGLFCLAVGLLAQGWMGWALFSLALLATLLLEWRQAGYLRQWLLREEPGAVPEVEGVFGDIYAALHRFMRNAERRSQDITHSLERFRDATRALPDGVVLLDNHHHIDWCNPAAERLLGISLGRDAGTLLTHLVRQPEFANYLAAGVFQESLVLRLPAPRNLVLSILIVPHTTTGRLVLVRDVSQMEQADRMQRDFIANVSHELRTPLTVLLGFLEHLRDDPDLEPAARHRFEQLMLEQTQRMSRLVEDVLTLSKLEARTSLPSENVVNVPVLLWKLRGEARLLSASRHEIELEVTAGTLLGNEDELQSAFGNLLFNAVRYTPEGGRILVSWHLRDGCPVYAVTDNGPGIAAEHIDRLTERFYRVDKGRSATSGGTGLGLSIVKQVLVHHQARLEIRSRQGEGSTFAAVFPVERAEPAALAA